MAVALTAVLGGCAAASHEQGPLRPNGPLGSVRQAAPPVAWRAAALPNRRATLRYPSGWHPARTDHGTLTYVRTGRGGRILGYLNVTPHQGAETQGNWSRFRPDHNRDEGDRRVIVNAAARSLRFAGGRGSCVDDSYRTSVTSYRELACLVAGAGGSTVIVAAAPVTEWAREQGTLIRALGAFSVT